MADRSVFTLVLDGFDPPPTPFGSGVSLTRSLNKILTIGNGDDQMSVLYGAESTLAALAVSTLDLRLDLDRYGTALAADDVAVLLIESLSVADGAAGGGPVDVSPSAADGLTNLLGPGSAVHLYPGSGVVFYNFTADKIDVTVTNKKLDLTNTHATLAATVRVQAWLRR